MRKTKILNAASPNFIHSLDAAHLIRTVLAANSEGIRDILTVHDSMACLAPYARRFGQLIRRELATLYIVGDPLAALRDANVDDPKSYPLPERGTLNAYETQHSEYLFI
jgi:DNA-directed RNA polymerase